MQLCLGLIAGWALLGAAACAVTFAISTIPAQVGFGRTIPLPLDIIEAALALGMLPLCTVGPVGLLVTGWAYVPPSLGTRRSAMGNCLDGRGIYEPCD